jgi:hypothetical protein
MYVWTGGWMSVKKGFLGDQGKRGDATRPHATQKPERIVWKRYSPFSGSGSQSEGSRPIFFAAVCAPFCYTTP